MEGGSECSPESHLVGSRGVKDTVTAQHGNTLHEVIIFPSGTLEKPCYGELNSSYCVSFPLCLRRRWHWELTFGIKHFACVRTLFHSRAICRPCCSCWGNATTKRGSSFLERTMYFSGWRSKRLRRLLRSYGFARRRKCCNGSHSRKMCIVRLEFLQLLKLFSFAPHMEGIFITRLWLLLIF